jgi:hypothetical protein
VLRRAALAPISSTPPFVADDGRWPITRLHGQVTTAFRGGTRIRTTLAGYFATRLQRTAPPMAAKSNIPGSRVISIMACATITGVRLLRPTT